MDDKQRQRNNETKEEQLVRIFNSVESIKFRTYKNGTDRGKYYQLYIEMNSVTVAEHLKKWLISCKLTLLNLG